MRQVLDALPAPDSDGLLTGFDYAEDAAAVRIDEGRAVIVTIDVITPLVDEPELFGAIAAANALSDVYAMGGRGLVSLGFLGAPKGFPVDVAAAIAKGGAELAKAEGAPVVGGHSIESKDLMYGLAAIGLAEPDALFRNDGFAAGDELVLTKPLGTGALTTALKERALGERDADAALAGMRRTNRAAADVARKHGVRAATDITGFGLLGHAAEVAAASGVRLVVEADAVPEYPGARQAIADGYVTRGHRTNPEYVKALGPLDGDAEPLLFDPQTSGGLLIGVRAGRAAGVVAALPGATTIGHVDAGRGILVI